MSQDEFSGRRNSVKRSGKRFTVDMRKELETLIVDCYGNDDDNDANEDGDDVTSPTTSTNESPMDADTPINTISATIVGSTSPVQQEITTTPPPSKQFKEITQPQDTATSPPSASPSLPISSPTTSTSPSPRKLVYSRSQSKISVSNLRVDGNGRSSNPIPVDANYGSGTSESEKQSGDAQATESVQTGDKPELSRRAQTLDLKVEVASSSSDKKQTSKSAPTSPTPTSNEVKGGRQSLFFDSAATRVARAVIITTNTVTGPQRPFTVYVMEVYAEGGQVIQNVSKRFKNFSDLVEKLKDRAPEISSMLPHKVLLGNMAARLVSHRKEQLQALLDYILGHKELSRSVDVLAFFRNPTLLKQLASKPDMEGYLNKGVQGTLGVKFIQMWTSLRSPCLYFWQSQSETAELKSAVVLRWLTVDVADEPTLTIELRPWQYLLFPSDAQSRPIIIRAGSRDEMIGWVRALHAAKAAVNDIIMLKKTMLQEEDATSELDLGDDEEDIVSPRLAAVDSLPSLKIPPLSLSVSSDAVVTKSSTNTQTPSTGLPDPTATPLRQNTPPSPAPASPRTNADSHHRNRIQTQPPNLQAPPKMTPRSNTEGHLALPRKNPESPSLSAPTSSSPPPTSSPSSPSPTSSSSSSAPLLARNSIAAKLKDFAEKTGSQPLSRFETRMALLQAPPKYP